MIEHLSFIRNHLRIDKLNYVWKKKKISWNLKEQHLVKKFDTKKNVDTLVNDIRKFTSLKYLK